LCNCEFLFKITEIIVEDVTVDDVIVNISPKQQNTLSGCGPVISIERILYGGEISLVPPKSIYIAAGLGIKKISFPFSVHHSSYNTRLLSTKGESTISLMQRRTCTNVLRRAI
jgi:hypothetical protein